MKTRRLVGNIKSILYKESLRMSKLHTQAFIIRFYGRKGEVLLESDVCQDICFIRGGTHTR